MVHGTLFGPSDVSGSVPALCSVTFIRGRERSSILLERLEWENADRRPIDKARSQSMTGDIAGSD